MNHRIFYLDNLRSGALLLGLVFHTLIIYATDIGYTVKSRETSDFYSWFVLFVHTFRMPLFFLLSGFFSELLLSKKGSSYFFQSRLLRVAVPILVGLFLFSPVDGYFREINKNGSMDYLTYLSQFFIMESFTLSHIWFLYYLLIFSLLFLLTRRLLDVLPKVNTSIFFAAFFVLGFISIFIPNLFFNKEDKILQIRPMFFFYYYFFYFVGSYIYRHNMLEDILPTPRVSFVLGFFLSIGFGGYMLLESVDQYWMGFLFDSKRIVWRVTHLLLEVSSSIGWVLIFLSFTRRFFNFENLGTKELANSLLPVYLVHHPLCIGLGFILGNGFLPREIAVLLHLFLVFSMSFGFYIVVKNFRFTSLLFGLKVKQASDSSVPQLGLTPKS